jgi:CBS-domain-containing membrane protein
MLWRIAGESIMSATVRDCMNAQLVYVREGDRPELALRPMLEFGITAVPVVDEADRPIGTVSVRDLADPKRTGKVISAPAATIAVDSSMALAARILADRDLHQLVVADADGRAVGMLSALDVIRGLLDIAPRHPGAIDRFARPTKA